jgi:phosphonate transport system substrate-binding protein
MLKQFILENFFRSRKSDFLKLGIFPFIGLLFFSSCSPKNDPNEKSVSGSQGEVIRLGLQPNEGSEDLSEFKSQLENLSSMKVEITVSKNYEDLVDKFKNSEVDFAFFSPINFITAEKEAGAKVLLKKVYGESEFYYSALIVPNDSPVSSVKDLVSKTVAFVDPKSTSGYLYPVAMLKEGLDGGSCNHEFLGTHELAVQALENQKYAAAAVWANDPSIGGGAWSKVERASGKKFRVLKYSDPIPNDAFVVRNKFYAKHPAMVFRVMEALISMSDAEESSLKKIFGTDKMTTATSRHYDSVRKMLEGGSK